MQSRLMKLTVLLVLVMGTTGFNPTMGVDTMVTADCEPFGGGVAWSFDADSYTSVGGGPTGTINSIGVHMVWAAGCGEAGCADEGEDMDEDTGTYASLGHGDSGTLGPWATFGGGANSSHWFDAELFSDSDATEDSDSDSCSGSR